YLHAIVINPCYGYNRVRHGTDIVLNYRILKSFGDSGSLRKFCSLTIALSYFITSILFVD
ncbi:MAG: hypothetical protein NDP22_04465, partial [Crenarchaeota archaeon]|nr:hypothetical protein [Thermoproteota archaeon]